MRNSNPPLHVFVEVVGLELVGICIDKFGNEDFYGFVGIHVGHLLGCMKFLLELGFKEFKSMNTCWVLGILLTSSLVFMFGLRTIWELFSMMLLDYFGFFGWIFGKMDEISKFGQFRGPTPWRT